MSQTSYSDLEQDNIFATAGVGWKPESRRTDKGRVYDFRLLSIKTGEEVHVIKDMASIVNGKAAAAAYCVEKLGGRPRDLTHEQKQDVRVGDVEARLAQTEMELAQLKKASAPADGDAPAPKKNNGGRPKNPKTEEGGDPTVE